MYIPLTAYTEVEVLLGDVARIHAADCGGVSSVSSFLSGSWELRLIELTDDNDRLPVGICSHALNCPCRRMGLLIFPSCCQLEYMNSFIRNSIRFAYLFGARSALMRSSVVCAAILTDLLFNSSSKYKRCEVP